MSKDIVGHITDPHTGTRAEVRQGKRGMYYVTPWGPVNLAGAGFQEWIRERLQGTATKPPAEKPAERAPEPPPKPASGSPAAPAPEKVKRDKGLLETIFGPEDNDDDA